MAIREYTQTDWYGLAGSECWEQDGEEKQPLMCDDFHEMFLTADKNGIFLYPATSDDEEECNGFTLNMDIPTQDIGRCLLRGIAEAMRELTQSRESMLEWALRVGFLEC